MVCNEYVRSTVQLTMPPDSAPTMMSANVSASCRCADLTASDALLDEFGEGVVQIEPALDAVAAGGQHFPDQLAVGVAGFRQRRGDVVEHTDKTRRDRFVGAVEHDVVQVDQPTLGQCPDHVLAGGEMVEERSIGHVGALTDLLDGRGRDALAEKQIEGGREDLFAYLQLPPFKSVHVRSLLRTKLLGKQPQRGRVVGVTSVGCNRFADAAVFEVQPTSVGQFGADRRPHLGGRTVFGRGEVEVAVGRFAACGAAGGGVFA